MRKTNEYKESFGKEFKTCQLNSYSLWIMALSILTGVLILAVLLDFFGYLSISLEMIMKFRMVNWLSIGLLFLLNKARDKAIYQNYAMIAMVYFIFMMLNLYIFPHYYELYFTKPFFLVMIATFLLALPIHEYTKLKKRGTVNPSSFLSKMDTL